MKRVAVCLLAGLFTVTPLPAHDPGRDKASAGLGKGKVTVEYGTPRLDKRNVEDMILPGFAWRMGMNESTTLDTTVALDFGSGKTLPAGKYALFARADKQKNWTLLISNQLSGSMLNPSTVVLDVPLHFTGDNDPQDLLKISLEESGNTLSLVVAWGTYRLRCNFRAAA